MGVLISVLTGSAKQYYLKRPNSYENSKCHTLCTYCYAFRLTRKPSVTIRFYTHCDLFFIYQMEFQKEPSCYSGQDYIIGGTAEEAKMKS